MLKLLVSVPVGMMELGKEEMIRGGFMTAKDYEEGLKEVQMLLSHRGAFAMGLSFLAVGNVP